MDYLGLILSFLVGLALGLVWFGGLWWTVRRLPASPQPALLLMGSYLVRLAVLILGFYLIGRGHWENVIICFAGILLIRMILIKRIMRHPVGNG